MPCNLPGPDLLSPLLRLQGINSLLGLAHAGGVEHGVGRNMRKTKGLLHITDGYYWQRYESHSDLR